jgi:alpha-tubulin suppressor-like RCC1 family protein
MMMAAAGSAGGSRYIGELWTWGDATNGKLGNGTSTGNLCSPEQVGADSDWMIVAESVCGSNADHCIIMKEDYTLWGFGTNTNY